MKKSLVILAAALAALMLAGCGKKAEPAAEAGKAASPAESVSITLLNSKGGALVDALEKMAAAFKASSGVSMEILNTPEGGSPFEKISTMYNSGNPPTIAMLDPTDVLTIGPDKAMDLSKEKWISEAGNLSAAVSGVVYGFPFCVEAKGLLYNKSAIDKALGGSFNSADIKNLADLTALFQKLQGAGMKGPMIIMKEDWSLGAHYLQLVYESQGQGTKEEIAAYIEQLKAGKVDLAKDVRFNQYMDTFDVLKKFNYKQIVEGDPMGGDNTQDGIKLAEGKGAFLFNGNWGWADFKDYVEPGSEFGLMNVPTPAADTDFTNTSIEAWASKHLMIDKEKAAPAQQEAAKAFLNWLVFDAAGQDAIVNGMNLIPAMKNNQLPPSDPLGKSIVGYVNAGKVFAAAVVPGDHWSIIGASMQKYLVGRIDRAGLAKEIEAYWLKQAK